jgi:hypothetical protein
MFQFGVGRFFAQASGDLDYRQFGVAALQEGGFGIEVDVKELHGRDRFAVDVRTGKGKIDGMCKMADWDPDVIALVLGVNKATTGIHKLATSEAGTVPASSAYTITVANSGTFVKNVEVVYDDDGTRLKQVAPSSEAAGKYSVSAGVYTFHAADAGKMVQITYMFSTTNGAIVSWTNVAIGTTPVCKGIFQGIHDSDQMVLELENVVPFNLKSSTKVDDWAFLDTQLKAFADPQTGKIGSISLAMS